MKKILKRMLFWSYRFGVHYIHSRMHFPELLNNVGLLGEGAEIGVASGEYSEHILKYWKGQKLFSIDPWMEYPREVYRDNANVSQTRQEEFYQRTVNRLKEYGNRSVMLRKTSAEAVKQFNNGTLDFVYIDARHHYEAVKEDIALWRPKVKRGGILAGHDYVDGMLGEGDFGVKSAVDEFVKDTGYKLLVTADNYAPSWFVFIPKKLSVKSYWLSDNLF